MHQRFFQDEPAHPDFSYSRNLDTRLRVKLQGHPDGLFDGPAAKKEEDMRPHAPGLDWGPALVDLRTAAHVSTAMNRKVHGLGQNVSHLLTDLVVQLQEKHKLSLDPQV